MFYNVTRQKVDSNLHCLCCLVIAIQSALCMGSIQVITTTARLCYYELGQSWKYKFTDKDFVHVCILKQQGIYLYILVLYIDVYLRAYNKAAVASIILHNWHTDTVHYCYIKWLLNAMLWSSCGNVHGILYKSFRPIFGAVCVWGSMNDCTSCNPHGKN